MSHPALAAPASAYPLEDEVREALEICGGDPMKALRITLIANAFLEAQIEHLSAAVSPDSRAASPEARGNSSAISTDYPLCRRPRIVRASRSFEMGRRRSLMRKFVSNVVRFCRDCLEALRDDDEETVRRRQRADARLKQERWLEYLSG